MENLDVDFGMVNGDNARAGQYSVVWRKLTNIVRLT